MFIYYSSSYKLHNNSHQKETIQDKLRIESQKSEQNLS